MHIIQQDNRYVVAVQVRASYPLFVISQDTNLHFDDKRKISIGKGNSNESKAEKRERNRDD